MTNARGDSAVLLSRLQSAFGTAESAGAGAFYKLPFYNYRVLPSEDLENDDAIQGDAFPGDAVAGLRNVSGSLEVPMGLGSIGWHLRALLGAPTTTGVDPAYTHVFETAAAPFVALLTNGVTHSRVAKHFAVDSLAYTGMELSARKNSQRQRVSFNVIAREEVGVAATLDSSPVTFSADPVPVGFVGKAKIDNSDAAAVTGASITLGTGVEADQETLNGLATAQQMDWGMWDLSGSLDLRFRDRTYYDMANAGTAFKLELLWTLGASSELNIELPAVRLERTGQAVEGRGILSSSFNFRAMRPASGTPLLRATLKNAVADYANPS